VTEVFVSYKRENLAAVGRLVEALRTEGVGVWWDQDIPANAAWEATIEAALAAAKLVIVAWSPAAVASENVKAEARWARGQGRLLQVFVEACEPPLFFGERQGVDLKRWSGAASDAAFQSVLEAVRLGLKSSAPNGGVGAAPAATLSLPTKPSIAVLPFANLSGDPGQDYFADGMVEEIVTALSRFRALFVIGAGSSLSYRGAAAANRKQIAQELGVRYLLDGSVRRAGERVRISVNLLDAVESAPIWAERFDGVLEDVFALQDTVASAVAGQIEPNIEGAEVRRANARPTQDLGAYELYLRAFQLFRVHEKAALEQALRLLDEAIDRDAGYALARALAGTILAIVVAYGWSEDPTSAQALAREQTRLALLAGADDPDVLRLAAVTTAYAGADPATADGMVDHALALNPGASITWGYSGYVKCAAGRYELAIEHLRTGLRLDPRSPDRPFVLGAIGQAMVSLRRCDEAAPILQEALQLRPGNPNALGSLLVALAQLGRLAEAKATADALSSLVPLEAFIAGYANSFFSSDARDFYRNALARMGLDSVASTAEMSPTSSRPGAPP
jgi:adenylate cyclase